MSTTNNGLYKYGLIALGAMLLVFIVIRMRKKGSGSDTEEKQPGPTGSTAQIKPSGKKCGWRTPRGIRNNNPGNLRISSSGWQGKIPKSQNTDGSFEQFTEWVYGVRAMLKLLRNYIAKGDDTINKIINRYAPSSDNNNTNQYINWVVQRTGITANKKLDRDDKTVMRKLLQSMVFVEIGCLVVTDEEFNKAWNLL